VLAAGIVPCGQCAVCSVPTRHCPVGRVLLKSGRPQTATGSDHGHQGRTLAGERGRIIRGGRYKHTHRTLWMQIAGLKVATHGGYQCAFTVGQQLIHGLQHRLLAKAGQDLLCSTFLGGCCPVITSQTALISHKILASTKTLLTVSCSEKYINIQQYGLARSDFHFGLYVI